MSSKYENQKLGKSRDTGIGIAAEHNCPRTEGECDEAKQCEKKRQHIRDNLSTTKRDSQRGLVAVIHRHAYALLEDSATPSFTAQNRRRRASGVQQRAV